MSTQAPYMGQKLFQRRKGPTKPLPDHFRKPKTTPHTAGTQGTRQQKGALPGALNRVPESLDPEGSCKPATKPARLCEQAQPSVLQSAAAEAAASSQRLFSQAGLLTPEAGDSSTSVKTDQQECIPLTKKFSLECQRCHSNSWMVLQDRTKSECQCRSAEKQVMFCICCHATPWQTSLTLVAWPSFETTGSLLMSKPAL